MPIRSHQLLRSRCERDAESKIHADNVSALALKAQIGTIRMRRLARSLAMLAGGCVLMIGALPASAHIKSGEGRFDVHGNELTASVWNIDSDGDVEVFCGVYEVEIPSYESEHITLTEYLDHVRGSATALVPLGPKPLPISEAGHEQLPALPGMAGEVQLALPAGTHGFSLYCFDGDTSTDSADIQYLGSTTVVIDDDRDEPETPSPTIGERFGATGTIGVEGHQVTATVRHEQLPGVGNSYSGGCGVRLNYAPPSGFVGTGVFAAFAIDAHEVVETVTVPAGEHTVYLGCTYSVFDPGAWLFRQSDVILASEKITVARPGRAHFSQEGNLLTVQVRDIFIENPTTDSVVCGVAINRPLGDSFSGPSLEPHTIAINALGSGSVVVALDPGTHTAEVGCIYGRWESLQRGTSYESWVLETTEITIPESAAEPAELWFGSIGLRDANGF